MPKKGSVLEIFCTDLQLIDNVHYCNFCSRNGHASLYCGTYPSYSERLKHCKLLRLSEFCTATSRDGRTCPGVKGSRDPLKYCNSQSHFPSMCPHFKPEALINTTINTKIGDT